jgi:hypothetical protein
MHFTLVICPHLDTRGDHVCKQECRHATLQGHTPKALVRQYFLEQYFLEQYFLEQYFLEQYFLEQYFLEQQMHIR